MFKIHYLFIVFLLIFVSACRNSQINNNLAIDNNKNKIPRIEFKTDFYDFGSVKQGEKLTYAFEYKNTGTADLLITDVIPSCGCTVPKYDKKPIKPGKKGEISVIFNTKGRTGSQYKEVHIKSNAENGAKTLTFKANIIIDNN